MEGKNVPFILEYREGDRMSVCLSFSDISRKTRRLWRVTANITSNLSAAVDQSRKLMSSYLVPSVFKHVLEVGQTTVQGRVVEIISGVSWNPLG